MNEKAKWVSGTMAALPLIIFVVVSMSATGSHASAVPSPLPTAAAKKSSSPLDGSPKGPSFPSHYFDRSTPALTVRHVSSPAGADLHPPPLPSRHSRLHHPHYPPLSLRRRPVGGETAPPYAVQMEPLVQYSPRDPLYANAVDSDEKGDKGEQRAPEGPEEPPQSLDEDKEELTEDQEGGAATLRSQQAEDKSSGGHPIRGFPPEIGEIRRTHAPQYPYHQLPQIYGPPAVHGGHYGHGPRYVVLKEPEPIIEIIVKESNVSLPPIQLPAVPPQPKQREPVQVFYVKYEKKKGKSGGEHDGVVFDRPVAAQAPVSPEPLPPVHIPEVEDQSAGVHAVTPLPVYTPPPKIETTTLRALIRPDSEQVHHPHSHTQALRVSFGEERTHRKESEAVEEEQSAPQPSFAAPNPAWNGQNGSPVPPFRQLPEQHFRSQQPTRFFPRPHQQQFGPQPEQGRQNQFPQQPRHEGPAPDARAFSGPPRSLPSPNHVPVGPNAFSSGQSFRSNSAFPPVFYSDLPQHVHFRQQQLQAFQQQHQQKQLPQFQDQQKQHQHSLQFQRLPPPPPFNPQNKPGPPSFQSGPPQHIQGPPQHIHGRPQHIQGPPQHIQGPQQHNQGPSQHVHGLQQHTQGPAKEPQSPSIPPFIRLPPNQVGRFPEPSNQQNPIQVGEIVKSISKLEHHQIQSPTPQGHSLSLSQQDRRPPQGTPQFPRNHPQLSQVSGGQPPHSQFLRNQQQGIHSSQQTAAQYGRPGVQQQPGQNGPSSPRAPLHLEQSNHPSLQSHSIQHSFPPQRQPQPQQSLSVGSQGHFNIGQYSVPQQHGPTTDHPAHHQHQTITSKPTPTPTPSYGTTILHYPTPPNTSAQQINSLGSGIGYHHTTPKPHSSTEQTTTTTTEKPIPELPDEIPDDLRQQLLSSGILSNADIQILDYDKIGDIPIESLPPEALSGLASSGLQPAASENKPVSVSAPPRIKGKKKEAVEMKVVRYNPGSEESAVDGLIRDDVEETKVLAPVATSKEGEKEEGYRRYLPLRISGERFPVPDVPELRGRNVTSVVVLAPVGFPSHGRERRAEGDAVAEEQAEGLLSSGKLNALVKNPSGKNFREWLDEEKSASPEEQAVVLLVAPKEEQPEEKGDIFMLDVGTGRVSQLRGELSAAFVQVANENAKDSGLGHKRHSDVSS
ncbi:extensin-2 [Ischnura elegans]|uniref:extensin-2 n=1 Tax=Ischnura elegans TaxID=197161 RepID=UPI001ED89566|nr:extensin-2 [Ischnura elegans]